MANPVLVPQAHKTIDSRASAPPTRTQASYTTTSTRKDTSVERQTHPDGLSLIRASLTGRRISEQAQEILLQSWRKGTQKQYETYLQKWLSFCGERHSDPLQPTIDQVIDFLTHLFISGIGYSAMNTARCALSTFVILEGNISVGSHPLVKRFLKAVYQCRTAFPRYTFVWDISIVLKYLKALPSLQDLQLKTLTLKLAMLCSLVTGQRSQSLHLMSLDHMSKGPDHCVFHIQDIVKQSAPGRKQPELIIPVFRAEPKLCIFSHLMEYLHRTEKLRGEEKRLFVSYIKPHKWVSKDTIVRWKKSVMESAGIDLTIFKPHSTRAATTSKAHASDVPLSSILEAGSWKNECTFNRFYNKPIQPKDQEDIFGKTVLAST